MKAIRYALLLWLWSLASPAPAQDGGAEGAATPLFSSDELLDIRLEGPLRTIVRQGQRSTEPHPATMHAAGETLAITLAARGVSRRMRENCSFPPLRIALDAKPDSGSLFYRQRRLKLVTHCKATERNRQALLREYAVYRLYGLFTRQSLRVRLAQVTYADTGKAPMTELAFLIEDADDAARRSGLKEVDSGTFPSDALEPEAAARYALFQYMVGNTDFAFTTGPDPEDCCHNSKLFGASKHAREALVPVPYDFDNAGLVDAPHAFPNAALPIDSVRTRLYRGLCIHNEEVTRQLPRFVARRADVLAELDAIAQLDARSRTAMRSYLEGFFDTAGDPQEVRRKILSRCR